MDNIDWTNPKKEDIGSSIAEQKYTINCGVSSTNHSYFEKKGEINELRRILRGLNDQQSLSDPEELREGLKKVIAVMTMGIDVRELFQEVIMLSYTGDLVSKKMIYLYLQSCSEGNEKLAIMAMNAFLKDCENADHRVRGLAIRTLSNMRTPTALEFSQQKIPEMLGDKDAYVRRNAVMAALKMFYHASEYFEEKRFVDKFYDLLKDPSSSVVLAAMSALNEIMSEEGGMALNQKIAIYLLNRFQDFNWYGKTLIAQSVSRYQPGSENELFNIMNLLEDCLKLNHCPLLLSVLQCFMKYSMSKPKLFKMVLTRSSKIFLNMVFMTQDEQLFNTLSHLKLLLKDSSLQDALCSEISRFFLRPFDPDYLIKIKLEIMLMLTRKDNLDSVLAEFDEYVSEKRPVFFKESLHHLGILVEAFPKKAGHVLKNILILVKGDGLKPGMLQVITTSARLLNKKLPDQYITFLEEILTDENTQQREPVNVMMCLLRLVDKLEKAPYILEELVDSMIRGEMDDHLVVDALIRVCVEMFLKRPGEVISILSKLLSFFLNEAQFGGILNEVEGERSKKENLLFLFTHVLLQKRARFYYEALKHSPERLKEVVTKAASVNKKKEKQSRSKELVVDFEKFGFNNLSIIYRKEEELFTKPLEYFAQSKIKENVKEEADEEEEEEEDDDDEESQVEEQSETESPDELIDFESEESEESESEESDSEESAEESDTEELLDLEIMDKPATGNSKTEDVDFLDLTPPPTKARKSIPKKGGIDISQVEDNFDLEEDDFQNKWMDFDHEYEDELNLKIPSHLVDTFTDEEAVEEVFSKKRVYTLASGEEGSEMKFYMFAKARSMVVLIELIIIQPDSGSLFEFVFTVKGNDLLLIKQFSTYLKDYLKNKVKR